MCSLRRALPSCREPRHVGTRDIRPARAWYPRTAPTQIGAHSASGGRFTYLRYDRSELSSNLEQLRPAFGSLYQCATVRKRLRDLGGTKRVGYQTLISLDGGALHVEGQASQATQFLSATGATRATVDCLR